MFDDIHQAIFRMLPEPNSAGGPLRTKDVLVRLARTEPVTPSLKTVLRRLQDLEEEGKVNRLTQGNGHSWTRARGAVGLSNSTAGMTFDEALALQILRRFCGHHMPELVAKSLSAAFESADKQLTRTNNAREKRYARWNEKVEMNTGGFTLHRPYMDHRVFSEISHALFDERKLKIVYRSKSSAKNNQPQVLLPLGLVETNGLIYLVATREDKAEPYMYRVDRFISAEEMPEPFEYPRSFSLARYVQTERHFDFNVEGEIELDVRFTQGAGDHLLETPMCGNQKSYREGSALRVIGTVVLSQKLRWWLRAFGPQLEVLAPMSLRAEFAQAAQQNAMMYAEQ